MLMLVLFCFFVLLMQLFLITFAARGCFFVFFVLFRLFMLAATVLRLTVVTGAVTAWSASDKLIYYVHTHTQIHNLTKLCLLFSALFSYLLSSLVILRNSLYNLHTQLCCIWTLGFFIIIIISLVFKFSALHNCLFVIHANKCVYAHTYTNAAVIEELCITLHCC